MTNSLSKYASTLILLEWGAIMLYFNFSERVSAFRFILIFGHLVGWRIAGTNCRHHRFRAQISVVGPMRHHRLMIMVAGHIITNIRITKIRRTRTHSRSAMSSLVPCSCRWPQ
jgi:hypothetical protein